MAYNDDLTWDDLARTVGTYGRNLSSAVREGYEQYLEWQSFRAGRDNATLAVAMGVTEARIADMDAAFAVFSDCHDLVNNVATSQSDRMYALRKFT